MSDDPYKYFMIEAEELLDDLNRDILEFEKKPDDSSLLKALFRYAHTLKGAAHVVGLLQISKLSHSVENLFSRTRDKGIRLTAENISLILEALDFIRNIIEVVKKGGEEDLIDFTAIFKKFEESDVSSEPADLPEEVKRPKPEIIDGESKTIGLKLEDQNPEFEEDKEQTPARGGNRGNTGAQHGADIGQDHKKTDVHYQATGICRPTTGKETIRISLSDVDHLMDQVSEVIAGIARLEQLHDCYKGVTGSCRGMLTVYRNIISLIKRVSEFGNVNENGASGLTDLSRKIDLEALYHDLLEFTASLDANIEGLKQASDSLYRVIYHARSIRAADISHYFKGAVRDLSVRLNKKMRIAITGDEIELDRNLLEGLKEPVNQIIRNAAVHGIEDEAERLSRGKNLEGLIRLDFKKSGDYVCITCEDDGRGISGDKIKEIALKKGVINEKRAHEISHEESLYLIFVPGISSGEIITEFAGRGVGLDIVKDKVESMRGEIIIETEEGKFTRFLVKLPLSLNMIDTFLVEVSGQKYLLPLNAVIESGYVLRDKIEYVTGKTVIKLNDSPVSFIWMSDMLGFDRKDNNQLRIPFVLLKSGHEIFAFAVDQLLGVERVIIKDLGEQLRNLRHFLGGAILSGGYPALLINVTNLFKTSINLADKFEVVTKTVEDETSSPVSPSILAVDDSLTTRMLISAVLESEGYNVTLAGSGEEALSLMVKNRYDLFIVDVEMPGIDGFELAEKIRENPAYIETPIIIFSSLSQDEHRRRGIEAGVQAYIVKGQFDQEQFLQTIKMLVLK